MKTVFTLCCFFITLRCDAQLTPAITQSSPVTINASSSTCVPVFGSNTTAGTNVLVFAQWASTSITASITDTLTNTWIVPALPELAATPAWSYQNTMGAFTVAGWLVNRGIGGADTITVTFSMAVKNSCVAIELGNLTYSPQEGVVNANYGGTQTAAMSVGPIVTPLRDPTELALCIGGDETNADTVTAGAGYNVLRQGNGSGQYFFVLNQTLTKAANTTPSCTATASSGSNQWMLTLITLDAALGPRNLPQLPLTTPVVAMPSTTGYTQATVCPSSCTYTSLATALTSVSCGTVLTLTAGLTYTLNQYALPSHSCDETHWIIVRSSGTIPPSGTRITPANVAQMPTIQSGSGFGIIDNSGGVSNIDHYRFVGLNFSISTDCDCFLLYIGDNSTSETANRIIIDRCLIQGNPNYRLKQGIILNAANSAIVDSYISEVHSLYNDFADAAAILIPGHNESGYLILNNFISGSGHDMIFGGGSPGTPFDITIKNNWMWKNPCWLPTQSCYTGPHWGAKTCVDIKAGTRMLFDSNVIDYSWFDTESGYSCFGTSPRTGEDTGARVDDVIFRNNLFRHLAHTMGAAGYDASEDPNWVYATMGVQSHRVAIYNNIFDDTGSTTWGTTGQQPLYEVSAYNGPIDLQIYHNTFVESSSGANSAFSIGYPPKNTGCDFGDNIVNYGGHGLTGGNGEGNGKTALDAVCYDYQFGNTALVGGLMGVTYPSGTLAPTDWTNASGSVRFVNYSNGSGGNYRLCTGVNTPASPCPGASILHNAASDGTDVGANVDIVMALTRYVTSGAYPLTGAFFLGTPY